MSLAVGPVVVFWSGLAWLSVGGHPSCLPEEQNGRGLLLGVRGPGTSSVIW